jgi:hypothetical protein
LTVSCKLSFAIIEKDAFTFPLPLDYSKPPEGPDLPLQISSTTNPFIFPSPSRPIFLILSKRDLDLRQAIIDYAQRRFKVSKSGLYKEIRIYAFPQWHPSYL